MPVTLTCTVCGTEFTRPPSHAARIKEPTCSRKCNGANRGRDWAKHGSKGRAAWSPETEQAYRQKITGEGNPCWRGGSYIDDKGYRRVRMPNHPKAQQNGYVLEHVLVAEAMLGRPLKPGEEVHHKNRVRDDNRPENLKVYASHCGHWMTEHYAMVGAARDAAASRKSSGGTAQL